MRSAGHPDEPRRTQRLHPSSGHGHSSGRSDLRSGGARHGPLIGLLPPLDGPLEEEREQRQGGAELEHGPDPPAEALEPAGAPGAHEVAVELLGTHEGDRVPLTVRWNDRWVCCEECINA